MTSTHFDNTADLSEQTILLFPDLFVLYMTVNILTCLNFAQIHK